MVISRKYPRNWRKNYLIGFKELIKYASKIIQLINKAKVSAENKYAEWKEALDVAAEGAGVQTLDLTMPGDPMPLGSRHPIATTLNRIVTIFQRMGFAECLPENGRKRCGSHCAGHPDPDNRRIPDRNVNSDSSGYSDSTTLQWLSYLFGRVSCWATCIILFFVYFL